MTLFPIPNVWGEFTVGRVNGTYSHVNCKRGFEANCLADGALDILDLSADFGDVSLVVRFPHMPRQAARMHKSFIAERTRLGLLVVNFLVPLQLFLSMKHLKSDTDYDSAGIRILQRWHTLKP